MTDTNAADWPEFHLAKYANPVVLILVVITLYRWSGEDVARVGFDSYAAFAGAMLSMVSGHALTLFVVSSRARSRFWKASAALTIGILVLSAIGLYAMEQAGFPWRQSFNWAVAFVYFAHLVNLYSLYRVAQLRRQA